MIKFTALDIKNNSQLENDECAITPNGEILIWRYQKYGDQEYTWERGEKEKIRIEFDPESAAEFLRSKGYKVKPPAEPSPVPNGCFRVECWGVNQPFFVEGQGREKEEISLDFQRRGYKVEKIEFAKDQFYFV